jgi:hypothetical protein
MHDGVVGRLEEGEVRGGLQLLRANVQHMHPEQCPSDRR